MIGHLIAAWIGGLVGFMCCAICVAAGRHDEAELPWYLNDDGTFVKEVLDMAVAVELELFRAELDAFDAGAGEVSE